MSAREVRSYRQAMRVTQHQVEGLVVINPEVHEDSRGFFVESFNQRAFEQATGVEADFVQDNHSRSTKGVLRGLHYQLPQAQGKLVRCARGSVIDVVVDIRASSPTFGKSVVMELSEDNFRQLWVPEGFAHGFLVTSDVADLLYKTTDYYTPESSHTIAWDDSELGIAWPLDGAQPIVSTGDAKGATLADAVLFP